MALRPVMFTRVVQPVRSLWQRFSLASMGVAAFLLMLLGNVDHAVVERFRASVTDVLTPVLVAVSRPAEVVSYGVERVYALRGLQDEIVRLRAENRRLREWWHVASRLQAENRELRRLARFVPPPSPASISARAITGTGGPFVRSMLVSAGRRHGVRQGQAAISGDGGLAGVVVAAGELHARVLLVTDLNSRIPVSVRATGDPGILSGDNSWTPRLQFLPQDARISTGDQVVTSGLGGVLPPGLPVGIVTSINGADVRVKPLIDWGRLDHLRLLEYGLPDAEDGAGP